MSLWYEAWETQDESGSMEALALLWRSEVRRADHGAASLLLGGGTLEDSTAAYVKLAVILPPTKLMRLLEVLNADGHVALATLVSREHFGRHADPEVISFYFRNIVYLGLHDEARRVILTCYDRTSSRDMAEQAVRFIVDRELFAQAVSFVAATTLSRDLKADLTNYVRGEEALARLIQRSIGAPTASVSVINLPQDRYRRVNFSRRLAELGIPHVVSRATRVDQIPEKLLELLKVPVGEDVDGSLGNQVSQYRVWERIAFQELPFGIIVEDDGHVKHRDLHRIEFDKIFGRFDIAFINDRMANFLSEGRDETSLSCLPLEDAMAIKAEQQRDVNALGSDGYVLSREGARKMLEIAKSEGFHSPGTDWYLISHSFDRRSLSKISDSSVICEVLSNRIGAGYAHRTLSGVVVTPYLVEHRPLGTWRNTRDMS